MTFNFHPIRYSLMLVAVLFTFAATDALGQRERIVQRSTGGTAELAGLVVEAETEKPLSEATVRINDKVTVTGADGRFKLTGLAAGSHILIVEHWAHAAVQERITIEEGQNSRTIVLTPKPVARFVEKNGTVHPVDPDSIRFGYVVAFAGWQAHERIEVCLPSGETVTVEVSDMASVTFPGQRTESTECCSLSPGTIARITRKGGAVVEGTIRSSCSGYEIFALGRNRETGAFDTIAVLNLERVELP